MWVEGGDIHDELLDQLGAVLTVPEALALTPSAAELEALAAAVAARWPDGPAAPAGEPAGAGTAPSAAPSRSSPLPQARLLRLAGRVGGRRPRRVLRLGGGRRQRWRARSPPGAGGGLHGRPPRRLAGPRRHATGTSRS